MFLVADADSDLERTPDLAVEPVGPAVVAVSCSCSAVAEIPDDLNGY